MASINSNTTIKKYQEFVNEVYGLPNNRYFSNEDMLTNIERFGMRALKGVRKKDKEKTKINLLIAQSWFMSFLNQLHINLEDEVWKKFPYLCTYCNSCPCTCKNIKNLVRQNVEVDNSKKPKNLKQYQEMFNKIYPVSKRTLEHASVHLAEEIGELAEAFLLYRGEHKDKDFEKIATESADLFSCIMGVFNSLEINVADELSKIFHENCHVCKKAPCECNFIDITNFKS